MALELENQEILLMLLIDVEYRFFNLVVLEGQDNFEGFNNLMALFFFSVILYTNPKTNYAFRVISFQTKRLSKYGHKYNSLWG